MPSLSKTVIAALFLSVLVPAGSARASVTTLPGLMCQPVNRWQSTNVGFDVHAYEPPLATAPSPVGVEYACPLIVDDSDGQIKKVTVQLWGTPASPTVNGVSCQVESAVVIGGVTYVDTAEGIGAPSEAAWEFGPLAPGTSYNALCYLPGANSNSSSAIAGFIVEQTP